MLSITLNTWSLIREFPVTWKHENNNSGNTKQNLEKFLILLLGFKLGTGT